MRKPFLSVLIVAALAFLAACGGSNNPASSPGPGSTTTESLDIAAGSTSPATAREMTVTGDANIDGVLEMIGAYLLLRVQGDLNLNGIIRPGAASRQDEPLDGNVPLQDQPVGLLIVVEGKVTLGEDAQLLSTGPIVITDDSSQLTRTPDAIADEAETASGDLPTLVPLPPDDPLFEERSVADGPLDPRQAPVVHVIQGNWDLSAFPGDQSILLFRFNGNPAELVLRNWRLITPPGVGGADDNDAADPNSQDPSARGGNGKRGMNLNIWNNNGPIRVQGQVTFDLADGGDGGIGTGVCKPAFGGDGAKAGNFRMTASGGIDLSAGALRINPGRGGHGGAAVSVPRPPVGGCPGQPGCDTAATGGKGADNQKRLLARGNIQALANLSIGDVVAGNGGAANATGGDGGPGDLCCDGGAGGSGTATGGVGGDASVRVSNAAIGVGTAIGGNGGAATAIGGNGGAGGNCKTAKGGDGGAAGSAAATGGAAGSGAQDGVGGNATATGGTGGAGGNSAVQIGLGGAPGGATATEGQAQGVAQANPGAKGPDGVLVAAPILFCFGFSFLANGPLAPAVYNGPLFDPTGQTQVGSLDIQLPARAQANYAKQDNPPHLGLFGGSLILPLNSINPPPDSATPIVGVQVDPFFAEGITPQNPLIIEALGPGGASLGQQTFGQVDGTPSNPAGGEPIVARFPAPAGTSIQAFVIAVPSNAAVYILRIYLLDP